MEGDICTLLKNAKLNNEEMVNALRQFTPLINKYKKRLFFLDSDDAEQELRLAFIQAVYKLKYIRNDGECTVFIERALRNHVSALCLQNKKNDFLIYTDDIGEYDAAPRYEGEYDDIELLYDYKIFLKNVPEIYKKIFPLLIAGYSDAEIASMTHYSKQYINRIKKKLYLFSIQKIP